MSLRLAEALDHVIRRCVPIVGSETIPLGAALRRILAEPVIAPMPVPPADNSAVDGYAFRHCDLAVVGDRGFGLAGVAAAGRPFVGRMKPGDAVRIFTGAMPPVGADSVAMQEDIRLVGGRVVIPRDTPLRANIRQAGEEIAQGVRVFAEGRRLRPAELGMLAALGYGRVAVRRKLRVAVLSAGEELIEPGEGRRDGAIHDANRPVLLALLAGLGIDATDLGILPDSRPAITAALHAAAATHDAIISTAGISVGDEDHVCAAVTALGAFDFRGVAIKPGRPAAFGHVEATPFFGLPGNPAAMLIAFLLLVRPGLIALAGGAAEPVGRYPAVSDFSLATKPGRRDILRCVARVDKGVLRVRPHALAGSAILSSIADSDGLVEIAEETSMIEPGAPVSFTPFAEYGL